MVQRTPLMLRPRDARSFLGRFSNETVSLSLDSLPAHSEVLLSFDLYIINSWDGNDTTYGPDAWSLQVAGGDQLLYTTFSNTEEHGHTQSYPDSYLQGNHPAGTGAVEIDTLGYSYMGDSVYHFEIAFPHVSDTVSLDFSASGLGDLSEESWGLDNVQISVWDNPIALPDLVVDAVVPPTEGWSGQQIDVSWTVRNETAYAAEGAWVDKVYLSDDDQIGGDTYLGELPNPVSLGGGESYTRVGTFTLPEDIDGDYWIVVVTDEESTLFEQDEANNAGRQ